jgi:hypothetical protein
MLHAGLQKSVTLPPRFINTAEALIFNSIDFW